MADHQAGISRRTMLGAALTGAAVAGLGARPVQAEEPAEKKMEIRYCLNMSTIRGQKLTMIEDIEVAAKAGYQSVEPWVDKLDKYIKGGGSLKDLDKRIKDLGLTVEDMIGFPSWIVDDDAQRAKGVDEAKRCMDMAQQFGCKRLAAPPVGATDAKSPEINLMKAAERYRVLLEAGDKMGVVPMVELWGFSKALHRLGETALVAVESGHPKACILPDVYHLYKGGSNFEGVKLLSEVAVQVFHLNDYPEGIPPDKISDKDRIYPGDGVAPLTQLFKDLRGIGFKGVLSLELFNPEYWKQDALLVAKTGLEKMKAAVQKSGG